MLLLGFFEVAQLAHLLSVEPLPTKVSHFGSSAWMAAATMGRGGCQEATRRADHSPLPGHSLEILGLLQNVVLCSGTEIGHSLEH